MSKLDLVRELHGDVRKNFPRRKYFIKHIDHIWFGDLMDFTNLKKQNGGYSYVLILVDGFSKFCWSKSLKTKSGDEVKKAFESIFVKSGRSPEKLVVDEGKNELFSSRINF
jgi:hypothetical protein